MELRGDDFVTELQHAAPIRGSLICKYILFMYTVHTAVLCSPTWG